MIDPNTLSLFLLSLLLPNLSSPIARIFQKGVDLSTRTKTKSQTQIVSVNDPSISRTYWKPKQVLWFSVIGILIYYTIILAPYIYFFEVPRLV